MYTPVRQTYPLSRKGRRPRSWAKGGSSAYIHVDPTNPKWTRESSRIKPTRPCNQPTSFMCFPCSGQFTHWHSSPQLQGSPQAMAQPRSTRPARHATGVGVMGCCCQDRLDCCGRGGCFLRVHDVIPLHATATRYIYSTAMV